jgi:hypothetical protein
LLNLFGMLRINLLGLLSVFIVLTMIVIEGSYVMNWLGSQLVELSMVHRTGRRISSPHSSIFCTPSN